MTDAGLWDRVLAFATMQYAFAVDATIGCVATGVLCGLIGGFLAPRGETLAGDAAAHATLPGVCAAFLVTGSRSPLALLVGGLASAGIAIGAVSWIAARGRTRADAATAVVLSVAFGAGVLLLSIVQRSPSGAQAGLSALLFGSAAAMTRAHLAQLLVLGGAAAGTLVLARRVVAVSSFDPSWTRSVGVDPSRWHGVLLLCASAIVVLAVQAVGAALASAMVVIPGVAGRQWSHRFARTVLVACAIGGVSGWLGAGASFVLEGVPTGPSMVVAAAVALGFSLAFGPAATRRVG